MVWETLAESAMPFERECTGDEEDCYQLFFECPFARPIWANQRTSRVDITPHEAFWGSLMEGKYMRGAEQERLFKVLWEVWLHLNKVILKGRAASVDNIVHDVDSFVSWWFRRT